MQSFATMCRLPASAIPILPSYIDFSGLNPRSFNINTAEKAFSVQYSRFRDVLGWAKEKEVAAIAERKDKLEVSTTRYTEMKPHSNNRVTAAFSGAIVAFESVPDKVSLVVEGFMNGIEVRSLCSPPPERL